MAFPAVNYLAVLVAAIVIFILGGLWYSPVLFAKKWVALQGKTEEQMRAEAASANMPLLYTSAFVTALITSFVMAHLLGHFAHAVDPSVMPLSGEMVVTKRRVSAFAGSDLEVILRGHRIEHLVLTGIATSGVVLSTLREAADKDYRLSVLSDACVDRDAEVHSVLTNKVFPRQAEVLTTADWVAGLKK